jgi:quinol monooxygenase YgiN
MYCSIRKYQMDPAQVDELMHRVDEGFAEQIQREPGFVAYQVLDCEDGSVVTVSTFRDRQAAEDSIAAAAAWIRDSLSDVEIERVDAFVGEAKVSRAIAEMLEPAHA